MAHSKHRSSGASAVLVLLAEDLPYIASGAGSLIAVGLNMAAARKFFSGHPGKELCDPLTANARRSLWSFFAGAMAAAEWVERRDKSWGPHVHHVGLFAVSTIAVLSAEETDADRRMTQYGRVMLTTEVLGLAVAVFRLARNRGFPGRSRAAALAFVALALVYRAGTTIPAWRAVMSELRELKGPAGGLLDHLHGHRLIAHLAALSLSLYDLHSWQWLMRQASGSSVS